MNFPNGLAPDAQNDTDLSLLQKSTQLLYNISTGGGGGSLPNQSGNAGKFLTTNGTDPSWAALAGGGDLLAANNLSDVASAATSRTNLGLAIGTNVQAYSANLTAWASVVPGTGVATALAVNVGSAGAFITFNGNAGTPSALVGTNITGTAAGLTAGVASAVAVGGITGLGTGVGTALAVNVGSAGAPVLFNGALGTPSGGTLTNCGGLPISTGVSGLGTGVATTLATNLSITGGGVIALGGFTATIPATLTVAGLGIANVFTAAQTISLGTNSATPVTALTLSNSTAATVGVQSASPATIWTGQGWKTTATAASQQVDFKAYVLPVQGSASPSARWALQSQINGGGFTEMFAVSSGYVYTLGSGNQGQDIQLGGSTINIKNVGGSLVFYGDSYALGSAGVIAAQDKYIGWSSTSTATGSAVSAGFYRKAAATIQMGADAAGVTNQMFTVASRITSDGVGANLTIAGGNGRGGAGGSLILSYYTTAAAATIGTLTTALTLDTTGLFTCAEGINFAMGTTTGTKWGTSTSQKQSFWNKTPIVQPTTGITAAAFVANTSGTVNDSATYGGYTIGQIAAALTNVGLLA